MSKEERRDKKNNTSNYENCPWFDGAKVYPQELYLHIKKECPLIIVADENTGGRIIYLYNEDLGYYEQQSETDLKSFIKGFIPIRSRHPRQWEQVLKEFNTDPIDFESANVNADGSIINFQNGLLEIETGKMIPHTPTVLSTIQIQCNYRPELSLDDAPIFQSYLNDLTSGEEELKTFLLEYLGAILSNVHGYRYKKLLLLAGAGDSGKSQLRELIVKLVGKRNCHSIDLKDLNNRFGTSQIYGKRLVGSGDMSNARISEIAKIKELTGGDDLNAEYKYENAFSYKYRGFLWFNCNDLPSFAGDQGKHVYKRFIIVPCKNVVPEEKQDSTILDKMFEEREAIVSAAIKYFKATVDCGYRFTEGPIISGTRKDYMSENNNICAFVETECDLTRGKTKRSDFYRAYKAWCRKNDIKNILGKGTVFAAVEKTYDKPAVRIDGEWYYHLGLKTIPSSNCNTNRRAF